MFVLYHDPERSPAVPHSLGLQKGLLGVVYAFADESMDGENAIVIAHGPCTPSARPTRYDPASGQPRLPGGYTRNLPRGRRLPQRAAEIMAGAYRCPRRARKCLNPRRRARRRPSPPWITDSPRQTPTRPPTRKPLHCDRARGRRATRTNRAGSPGRGEVAFRGPALAGRATSCRAARRGRAARRPGAGAGGEIARVRAALPGLPARRRGVCAAERPTAAEVHYFATDCEPRLLVCDPARTARALADVARDLRRAAAARLPQAGAAERRRRCDLRAWPRPTPGVPRAVDDLAAILYLGHDRPFEGARCSRCGNLAANARTLVALWRRFSGGRRAAARCRSTTMRPVHRDPLRAAAVSATTHLLPRFDASRPSIRAAATSTVFMGVPTYYMRLLSDPGFDRGCVRSVVFICGSAPLRDLREFERRTGQRILESATA